MACISKDGVVQPAMAITLPAVNWETNGRPNNKQNATNPNVDNKKIIIKNLLANFM